MNNVNCKSVKFMSSLKRLVSMVVLPAGAGVVTPGPQHTTDKRLYCAEVTALMDYFLTAETLCACLHHNFITIRPINESRTLTDNYTKKSFCKVLSRN